MSRTRTLAALAGVFAAALLLLSGRSGSDPETPAGLPGMPPPFLGVAVLGDGGLTAAVDAYGNVVDLRAPGPAGRALIDNPAERQAAGTVEGDTGIQILVRVAGGPAQPMWEADSIRRRYLPDSSVLRTVARFGSARVVVRQAVRGEALVMSVHGSGAEFRVNVDINCDQGRSSRATTIVCWAGRRIVAKGRTQLSPVCGDNCVRFDRRVLGQAAAADRRWLDRSRSLGASAPGWATEMYDRSLLVLHALTDHRSGAVAAGARDGWAYVWPRDASAAAIAYAAAGYRPEAERVARFLLGLGLEQAARFHGDGSPVPGREAQGDSIGWVAAAAQAAGLIDSARHARQILAGGGPIPWRNRADYQEGDPGDYLGNALASVGDMTGWENDTADGSERGLYRSRSARRPVRRFGDPESGLDSAAAWGVRPFPHPGLYPAIRRSMLQLSASKSRFGITPGEDWPGGDDPWSAPTAWTAWSLAALGERREALQLMQALRRSATAAGDLPERVDAKSGIPRSTTPLAWSHAFAILALRELWP
jgi:hypothetical protein